MTDAHPTYSPKLAVTAALDHLAVRLDPIISAGLGSALAGLPWTAVLVQLDNLAGRPPRTYATTDLQAQLKMFTRRLGNLGYPFDDARQTVGTLGRELTIVRNARAHGDEFTVLDSWRALDYCVRLLEHFEDDGAEQARVWRREALEAYVVEQGIGAPTQLPDPEPQPVPAPSGEDVVLPPSGAFERTAAPAQPSASEPDHGALGEQRPPFEPWSVVTAGTVEVLDDLPKHYAKDKVRAVATEIVDAEWPIHIDRLASLVAASFGIQRLRAARAAKIARQVKAAGLHIDGHKFVWPDDETASTWAEFRPNASDTVRQFNHISPVEIANALNFHRNRTPDADDAAVERATLQTFGRTRRTNQIGDHLGLALAVGAPDRKPPAVVSPSAAAQVR